MQVGDVVRICNLQSAAQHNGAEGTVTSWHTDTQRFGVETNASPNGLKLRERNVELLRLGEGRLHDLSPCARQLTHYLQSAEGGEFDWPMLAAHGLELPLYFFNSYCRLRGLLDNMGLPSAPHRRLTAMSTVVKGTPVKALTSSMYAEKSRNDASAAEPMAYPFVVACG